MNQIQGQIPKLTIAFDKTQTHYGLAGWKALDEYGRRFNKYWKECSDRCEQAGLNEADTLRMLCAAMLAVNEAQHAALNEAAEMEIVRLSEESKRRVPLLVGINGQAISTEIEAQKPSQEKQP